MREEDIIRRKFGSKEPFTVPENYFADFAERLMNELPEKNAPVVHTPIAKVRHLRYWLATAAVVCSVAVTGAWIYLKQAAASKTPVASVAVEREINVSSETESLYMEDMLDYALVDNSEIAMYLTGSN